MMSGSNVTHVGNLGDDPQVHTSQSGNPFVTGSLAVNTAKDKVSWYRITAFGKAGDMLAQCQKGSGVAIFGDQEIENWEGDDGNMRTTVRVIARKVIPLVNFEWTFDRDWETQ